MKKIKNQQLRLIEANNIFTHVEHIHIKDSTNKEATHPSKKVLITESKLNKEENDNAFYDDFLKKINDNNHSQLNINQSSNKASPGKKERQSIKNHSKTKKERNIKTIRNFVVQSQPYSAHNEFESSPFNNRERSNNIKSSKRRNALDIKNMYNNMMIDHNKISPKKKIVTTFAFKKIQDDQIEKVVQIQFNSIKKQQDDLITHTKTIKIEHNNDLVDYNVQDKDNKDKDNNKSLYDINEYNSDNGVSSKNNIIAPLEGLQQIEQCEKEDIAIDNNKNTNTNTQTEVHNNKKFNTNIHHIKQIQKISSSLEFNNSKKLSQEINQIVHSVNLSKSNNNISSLNQLEDINRCQSIKKKKIVKKIWCFFCIPTV